MSPLTLTIPVAVRSKALSRGAPGREWLARLPVVCGELEEIWGLTLGDVKQGGTESLVLAATQSDGGEVVVKVAPPWNAIEHCAEILTAANGHGYVHLLAYDVERGAFALEALGSSIDTTDLSARDQMSIIVSALECAWRLSADALSNVDAEDPEAKAESLLAFITTRSKTLPHGCQAATIEFAEQCARRRIDQRDPSDRVMVHGDPHRANVLSVMAPRPGAPGGFVFVDPEGFVGERAYDLGVVLRDWSRDVLTLGSATLWSYAEHLARSSGVDVDAIWEWAFVERVSTGLFALECGLTDMAQPFLASADQLVADGAT